MAQFFGQITKKTGPKIVLWQEKTEASREVANFAKMCQDRGRKHFYNILEADPFNFFVCVFLTKTIEC
jgi:hypothetical protein